MHYIGDSYPASLTSFVENMCIAKFSFFPGKIYVSDEARYETTSKQIDQNHLIETYEGYGYRLVEVPKDTIDNRILFYLGEISK
jgi:hypothetical protein